MDFGDFYEATSHRTLRYAYGLTGDLQLAQDVTQEAYARAWQRWRQVSAYENIEAWVRLVVNRQVQDWWRHLRVRSRTRLEQPAAIPGPSEDAVVLASALKQLPKAQSRALALYYLLDLPVADIAAETGVSENTVRSWLARGRAGLADRLRDEADAATVPSADHVADHGRRQRRTRVVATVTAAGLAVLAVLSIIVAVTRAKAPEHPVTPVPSATTLRRIGAPLPYKGQAFTKISDGRAFVAAYDSGTLSVSALDTQSGRPLWTQAVPGPHGEEPRLFTEPGVLIVQDVAGGEPDDQAQMTVLDAETGTTLWSRQFAGPDSDAPGTEEHVLPAPAAAILVSPKAGQFRGLDWRTGGTLWTVNGGGDVLLDSTTLATGPVDVLDGMPPGALAATTFYVVESDATIRQYAVATGQPTGRKWTNAPGVTAESFISRGKLYILTDTELSTFDLGGDGPDVSYTAHAVAPGTRETHRLWTPRPCGDGICLTDGGNPEEERGRNPYLLVRVRAGADPQTLDLPTDDWAVPVGDTVFMARGAILDLRLRSIKPAALDATLTLGVEDGKALLVKDTEPDAGMSAGPMHFWTFDAATGAVVDLGGLTLPSVQLTMGDHRLLAITEDGAQLYSTQG